MASSASNPGIKKAFAQHSYTSQQIQELVLSADDPVHFVRNHCKIQHPVRGDIPFKLYPYQENMLNIFNNNRLNITLLPRQSGKPLAITTEIATTNGWTTMEHIKEGDYVFGLDGSPTKVISVSDIKYDRPCFEIEFSTGEKIVADEDHLWTVNHKTRQFDREETLTTSALEHILASNTFKSISIPVCQPVQYPHKDVNLDFYQYGSSINFNSDFFDSSLLVSDISQRTSLLQGIMDNIGEVCRYGTCFLYIENDRVRNDIRELITSLGYHVEDHTDLTFKTLRFSSYDYNKYHPFKHNSLKYQLQRIGNDRQFDNKRLITRITRVDSVPVRCISVDNFTKLFLITRSFIATHNSWTAGTFLLHQAMFNAEKTILIASNKNSNAMEMINRAQFVYERLPDWIKPGITTYTKHSLEFDNGSRILSQATTADTGRGLSISCVVGDTKVLVLHKPLNRTEYITIKELYDRLVTTRYFEDVDQEIKLNNYYYIWTPVGWCNFYGVLESYKPVMRITTDTGQSITCTYDHKIKMHKFVPAINLKIGAKLANAGNIVKIEKNLGETLVYDPINVVNQLHQYYANGFVNHNCLFLDEFAFVPANIQADLWASLSPTLSTGGSLIICSTPNGDVDMFSQLWRGANIPKDDESNVGINGFVPYSIKWTDVPGRDIKFKEAEIAKVGETKWRQEYECEFISSDPLLIDPLVLANLTNKVDQIKPEVITNDIKFYEHPRSGATYLMGIDPSTGTGEDFTAVQVFRFPEMIQAAEYRTNNSSPAQAFAVIKRIIKLYEKVGASVYYTVENNGVGEGILTLIETDDEPPEYAEMISDDGKREGMATTGKSKIKSCLSLKDLVERDNIKINSSTLVKELKHFVRSKGSYNAQRGATDDLIMATILVIRILEQMATFDPDAYDKLYLSMAEDESDYDDDYDPRDFIMMG